MLRLPTRLPVAGGGCARLAQVSPATAPCWRLTEMPALRLQRCVSPERLDVMPPDDPAARRSRRDLQRVHLVMRSLTILCRATHTLCMSRPPQRILELGAGDG